MNREQRQQMIDKLRSETATHLENIARYEARIASGIDEHRPTPRPQIITKDYELPQPMPSQSEINEEIWIDAIGMALSEERAAVRKTVAEVREWVKTQGAITCYFTVKYQTKDLAERLDALEQRLNAIEQRLDDQENNGTGSGG